MLTNYANWELTQLLPEINPFYCKQDEEYNEFQFHWFKNKETQAVYIDHENALYVHECGERYDFIRNAWTWEEIRLYLESKGFNINYKHNLFNDKVSWSVCVNNMTNRIFLTENIEQDSYQQAREEAIKWCLNYVETSNN